MITHGLPFTADLALAIREGSKTQTRRPMDPQPSPEVASIRPWLNADVEGYSWFTAWMPGNGHSGEVSSTDHFKSPLRVGDRVFVQTEFWHNIPPPTNPDNYQIWDEITQTVRWEPKKDGAPIEIENVRPHLGEGWVRCPAKEMPSWAARTWLEITEDPIPQRIQEISEADIIAEGCPSEYLLGQNWFRPLWESIYPGSWERNDWVWAYTFKIVEKARPE